MKYILIVFITLTLLFSVPVVYAEWPQDAGNAQRTGFTQEEPALPWSFQWVFNGPDSSGGIGGHVYDAPREARTVSGAGKVFVPAGTKGFYGLNITNGHQDWVVSVTSFVAAPAFDNRLQSVFAGGSDGTLYKIQAGNGTVTGTYSAGSMIRKAVLLNGNFVYVVTENGQLHKISADTMQRVWVYSAGSKSDTPPSYSIGRDVVVYATNDLYVHAVNNSSGTLKWKTKPTPNTPSGTAQVTTGGTYIGNQFDRGWPVVAEKHGVVFLRMQLDHQAHYEGPNGGRFANTNAENRTWLQANPQWKSLFALNLDDGSEKFIPAVGYGSTEDFVTNAVGVMGSQPVVKVFPDGTEVVYIHFRSLQGSTSDYRWSGHLGEMVLDNTTVSGMVAGDLRFVQSDGMNVHIIDEENPITMAGNSLFHNHWAAASGVLLVDRSSGKGLTYQNPISTSKLPPIMHAIRACGSYSSNHYSSCSGVSYTTDGGSSFNGRSYGGPAFYSYWNVADPPGWRVGSGNTAGTSYSAGFQPRYLYVTDGYIVEEGNGGDVFVLKHSGSASTPRPSPTTSPSVRKPGDANGDNTIDGKDYITWVNNYGMRTTKGSEVGDFNADGTTNGSDYIIWLTNYGR